MSNFIQAEEGYYSLGTAGYYVMIAFLLINLILWTIIFARKQNNTRFSAKCIAFCGVAIALGFILSYIKLEMPNGGSVTVLSMFCICIIGYFYGIKVGIFAAAAYSILQFIQGGGAYMLSPLQICCDYFFSFTALGITGFFYKKQNKFILAYCLAILARGLFLTVGGYLYWMDYMPENFPKSLAFLYPVIYNYSYILVEGAITVILLKIPAVNKMFKRLQALAEEN
ncbi:MAG: energy-coupled thiamine transporter ThiT [Lachnospiraceae bacterium]|nr:energy-coupled thiamine transporter ThiT [Lachnospiraceae bacterium]